MLGTRRKDSFITHRAFCDALTEESARLSSTVAAATNAGAASGLAFKSNVLNHDVGGNPHLGLGHELLPSGIPQLHPLLRHSYASGDMSQDGVLVDRHRTNLSLWLDSKAGVSSPHQLNAAAMEMPPTAAEYLAATSMGLPELLQMASAGSTFGASQVVDYGGCPVPQQSVAGLSLSNPAAYGLGVEEEERKGQLGESAAPFYACNLVTQQESSAHMSATALLQKAAQMGATTSGHHSSSSSSSFLSGFGGLISSAKSTVHPAMENKNEFQLLLNQKEPATAENFHHGLLLNTLPEAALGNGENQQATTTTTTNASHMMSMMAAAGREQHLLMPGRMNAWSQEAGRGLTRDFLGVGGDEASRPFLQQELAKFASLDSGIHLMSASYDGSR